MGMRLWREGARVGGIRGGQEVGGWGQEGSVGAGLGGKTEEGGGKGGGAKIGGRDRLWCFRGWGRVKVGDDTRQEPLGNAVGLTCWGGRLKDSAKRGHFWEGALNPFAELGEKKKGSTGGVGKKTSMGGV